METNKKHIKPFWAIVAVATVALLAGGAIFYYSYDNQLQDDLYSITFTSPVHLTKTPKKALSPKMVPPKEAVQK